MSNPVAKTMEEAIIKPESVTTVIDKGVEFSGKIKSSNGRSIMVHGVFEGSIETTGGVIVSEGGLIRGSVNASRLNLQGTIEKLPGDGRSTVVVADCLVMEKTGRLTADTLSYGALQMELGAVVRASMAPMEKATTAYRAPDENQEIKVATPAAPSAHLRRDSDMSGASISLSFPAGSGTQVAGSSEAAVRPADTAAGAAGKVIPLSAPSPLVANA